VETSDSWKIAGQHLQRVLMALQTIHSNQVDTVEEVQVDMVVVDVTKRRDGVRRSHGIKAVGRDAFRREPWRERAIENRMGMTRIAEHRLQ
jgi:hypothetical protein